MCILLVAFSGCKITEDDYLHYELENEIEITENVSFSEIMSIIKKTTQTFKYIGNYNIKATFQLNNISTKMELKANKLSGDCSKREYFFHNENISFPTDCNDFYIKDGYAYCSYEFDNNITKAKINLLELDNESLLDILDECYDDVFGDSLYLFFDEDDIYTGYVGFDIRFSTEKITYYADDDKIIIESRFGTDKSGNVILEGESFETKTRLVFKDGLLVYCTFTDYSEGFTGQYIISYGENEISFPSFTDYIEYN